MDPESVQLCSRQAEGKALMKLFKYLAAKNSRLV
jgi:hypothetical protein